MNPSAAEHTIEVVNMIILAIVLVGCVSVPALLVMWLMKK